MTVLKNLTVGFALAASIGATGAMAAGKDQCFTDEDMGRKVCATAIVQDGSASRAMTGVTVTDLKTKQVCKADKGRILVDAQGVRQGYIISSPKCSK